MDYDSLSKIRVEILQTGRTVKIVAVTKYVGTEETNEIIKSGVDAIGENRVEQAREKFPHLNAKIEKHFIGPIQSNKIKDIVELFDVIQSVGSIKHLTRIEESAKKINKNVSVFLQFNISGEAQKGGFTEKDLSAIADAIKRLEKINVIGLMGMASRTKDNEVIRTQFKRLREYRDQLQSQFSGITELSMGMSDDYKLALEEGSTVLRLGRLLIQ